MTNIKIIGGNRGVDKQSFSATVFDGKEEEPEVFYGNISVTLPLNATEKEIESALKKEASDAKKRTSEVQAIANKLNAKKLTID